MGQLGLSVSSECGSWLGFGWLFLNDHQNHFINSQKMIAAALLGSKARELPSLFMLVGQ